MAKYPETYGKKMPGVLPDLDGPLSVGAEAGDPVPQNDMGALPWNSGASAPDPLGVVIKDGKK